MALIKCSECGNEVSDQANSCPKCGAPVRVINQKRCTATTRKEEAKWIQENDPEFFNSLKIIEIIGLICCILGIFTSIFFTVAAVISLIKGIKCKSRGYNKSGNVAIGVCVMLFVGGVVLLFIRGVYWV